MNVLLLPSVLRLEISELSHSAESDLEVWMEVVALFIKIKESSQKLFCLRLCVFCNAMMKSLAP